MARYRISLKAQQDLEDIAIFTVEGFGKAQARRYRDGLLNTVKKLVLNPHMGRSAEHLGEGLRAFAFKSHTLYYLPESPIIIVRVLHQSMDVRRHL